MWERLQTEIRIYFLVTLHRPANVDDPVKLKAMLDAILEGTGDSPVLFPVHPRTRQKLEADQISASAIIPG